jgi:hypothetical protein
VTEERSDFDIDHDGLIHKLSAWRVAEANRASDAAETRQEIGRYLEDAGGLNKKALSHIRQVFKMDEDKRNDYLRTYDALMAELRMFWYGNSTPDMFDETGAVEPTPADEEERKSNLVRL